MKILDGENKYKTQVLDREERNKMAENMRKKQVRKVKLKILGITTSIALSIGTYSMYKVISSDTTRDNNAKEDMIEDEKDNPEIDDIVISPVRLENNEEQEIQQIEKQKQVNIIDKLIQIYNSKVDENQQINIQDIGIIKEDLVGNGNIYREYNSNGEEIYIQNHLKGMEENYGIDWINGEEIKQILVIINKKNQQTLSGIIEIKDGQVLPIDIQSMLIEGANVYKKSENYVFFNKSNIVESYKLLEEEWKKRYMTQQNDMSQQLDEER